LSKLRQGDISLFQTEDGGNISIVNGEPVMDGGFESSVDLTFFGSDGNPHWMEEYQDESEKMFSKLFNFLKSAPKTVVNINRAEELARDDLQWYITDGIADTINVRITSQSISDIILEYEILLNGETLESNQYKINWNYQKVDPATSRRAGLVGRDSLWDGLQVYLKSEDAADMGKDSSFENNDGVATDVLQVNGKYGKDGLYNGTTANINLGDIFKNPSGHSFGFWFKRDGIPVSDEYIFSKYDNSLNSGYFVRAQPSSGVLLFQNFNSGSYSAGRSTGVNLCDGIRHYVIVRFIDANNIQFVIDNSEKGIQSITNPLSLISGDFVLGEYRNVLKLSGNIGLFSTHNRILTSEEIGRLSIGDF